MNKAAREMVINSQVKSSVITCSIEEMAVESFNGSVGELKGYYCAICKNKGMVAELIDGQDYYKPCSCMSIRRIGNLKRDSGIENLLERYTFDNFKEKERWQTELLNKAKKYIKTGGWFFIGGQVGSGKTHICTAIVKELLNKGVPCKYMLWRNEASRLKANVNDDIYSDMIKPLVETRVLYIDDFFKGGVTQGDINLAFEILNDRYNSCLATIISSEKTINEILGIDEAIGSRIVERSEEFITNISKDNYRLKRV